MRLVIFDETNFNVIYLNSNLIILHILIKVSTLIRDFYLIIFTLYYHICIFQLPSYLISQIFNYCFHINTNHVTCDNPQQDFPSAPSSLVDGHKFEDSLYHHLQN